VGKWLKLASLICALKLSLDLSRLEDRLILQKIAYLIQKLNLDLEYEFRWHTYGPYSRSLAYDTHKISITLKSKCKELELVNKDILNKLSRIIDVFRKIARDSGIRLSRVLEIAASLVMLQQDVYPRIKNPVLEIVKRKKNISKDLVVKIYKTLLEYKLLRQE